MLCPYCLETVTFEETRGESATLSDDDEGHAEKEIPGQVNKGPIHFRCPDPKCKQFIPTMYVRDYARYPPVVACSVGFAKHGKTVFFGSLFHTLRSPLLNQRWPDFFTLALDDPSLKTVIESMRLLDSGRVPQGTPKNFPKPTLLRVANIPTLSDCTLAIYDTSGESFMEAQAIQAYGRFVVRSRTVLFLVSIPELLNGYSSVGQGLDHLLGIYVVGLHELGGNPLEQNLVVVYTKADILSNYLDGWKTLQAYVRAPAFDGVENMVQYRAQLQETSMKLHKFTLQGLRAGNFVTTARNNFRSVSFTMMSSLGAPPNAKTNELEVRMAPVRVLDPLLMLMAGGPMASPDDTSFGRRERNGKGIVGKWLDKLGQIFE